MEPKPEIAPETKKAIRNLLRAGGHKPSGRGRPASETLVKALERNEFPVIHPVVDFFNHISLNSGFPISVLDAELVEGEWSFRLGAEGESYVFNPSGQEMSLKGLLLLADQVGPTATPVKDAQRTKVSESTKSFFVIVWGSSELASQLEQTQQKIESWLQSSDIAL